MKFKKLTQEEIKKKYQQQYEMRLRAYKKAIAKQKKQGGKKKRKKRKKRDPNSIPSLISKLTKVFNLYIRYRDCLKTTGTKKFGVCVSSGKTFPIEKLDAGHFIASTYSIYRFDERNVHTQSRRDNRFFHGNLVPYTLKMIELYGKEVVDEMNRNKFKIKKWDREELKELIKKYTNKLNELL